MLGSVERWFNDRFPGLAVEYGAAVLEEPDKQGCMVVSDICQPFFAATLGELGTRDAPTVYLPAENRFWTYSPSEGVFVEARDAELLLRTSKLFLEAARACPDAETKRLAFGFRDSAQLVGVLRRAQGQLAKPQDYFTAIP